jgi:hypothetical protein
MSQIRDRRKCLLDVDEGRSKKDADRRAHPRFMHLGRIFTEACGKLAVVLPVAGETPTATSAARHRMIGRVTRSGDPLRLLQTTER